MESNDRATFSFRKATLQDADVIRQLIVESARGLSRLHYTAAQIEAALGSAWGLDTQLIRDNTYFVVEAGGEIVACGGWSRRKTLFGSDAYAVRQSELLDPARDAARIRAFFVHPEWARRGIARALLQRCEDEARAEGFKSAALVATLPGVPLYEACGYLADDPAEYPLGNGMTIVFVPMRKSLG